MAGRHVVRNFPCHAGSATEIWRPNFHGARCRFNWSLESKNAASGHFQKSKQPTTIALLIPCSLSLIQADSSTWLCPGI